MSDKDLEKTLSEAVALKVKTEIVEFKEAKESYDPDRSGKYFSVLTGEANLKGKPFARLIFGAENTKH
jgi:ATP-dependent DNA helicase RecG